MMRAKFGLLVAGLALVPAGGGRAEPIQPFRHHQIGRASVPFALAGVPVGTTEPAKGGAAYLAGSRIAALDHDALAIDADSGKLVRDRDGKLISSLDIGHEAGLLVHDPIQQLAYVANRTHDAIAIVDTKGELRTTATIRTPAEPWGVALTPDRKTLLVTTIADRLLVAYDPATRSELWRRTLGREPRAVAVSPDGKRALVSYLATGTVDQVDLVTATHPSRHIALTTTRDNETVPSFARASFAVAFLGNGQAVVPYQRETPVQTTNLTAPASTYGGGGAESPIIQQIAFVNFDGAVPRQVAAQSSLGGVRALAWDSGRDVLFFAGQGRDQIVAVAAASTSKIRFANIFPLTGTTSCGPEGIALGADGELMVWCAFNRTVTRLNHSDQGFARTRGQSDSLVASRWSATQHRGYELFHSMVPQTSRQGMMACVSCHPDGRADGLSWRIDTHELQTPVLAGRVANTHPYKWDGGDADLPTSLTMTMKRLGGSGLMVDDATALQAYVESLPAVRTPTRDSAAVGRGKRLFESEGCRTCHDGPTYADNRKHELTGTLREVDTPSLIGLAASAPYYHDGSAPTLDVLLRDQAAVHGMTDAVTLSPAQVSDLVAFLETL